jgi:DNA (cytosine-5)-methyltransferase 1
MTLTVLSTFSGIGGLDLGLESIGMRTVGQVEIDPFARQVLARHWPEVPQHDDIRTAAAWWRSAPRPVVDVIAGATPASRSQPLASGAVLRMNAGSGLNSPDSLTTSGRPESSSKTSWGTERKAFVSCSEISTLSDIPPVPALSALARWEPRTSERGSLSSPSWPTPTASLGSNGGLISPSKARAGGTLIEAVSLVMWPTPGARLGDPKRGVPSRELAERRYVSGRRNLDDAVALWPTPTARDSTRGGVRDIEAYRAKKGYEWIDAVGHRWWAAEPDVGRVAYGVPRRVDRLRTLGNAVVPAVGRFVGELYLSGAAFD